jgi:hypothetical protein
MKQLFANALVSLVSGIFLVLGVGGALWIGGKLIDTFGKKDKEFTSIYKTTSVNLPSAAILEHSIVKDVPKFMVRGTVKNIETREIELAQVTVDVLSDGVKVNSCRSAQNNSVMKPGEQILFIVGCADIESNLDTAKKITYQVTASRLVFDGEKLAK